MEPKIKPIGPQSAFGHYRAEKVKAGLTPVARKLKGKYNDLCNKKKNKKIKKAAAVIAKKPVKKSAKLEVTSEDWSVRRVQSDDLRTKKVRKTTAVEENSRVAGQNVFQDLLSSTDVDKFLK